MELRDSYRLYASPTVTRRRWEMAIARSVGALAADWRGLAASGAERLPSVLELLRAPAPAPAPAPGAVR
jgi:hypothetical protein